MQALVTPNRIQTALATALLAGLGACGTPQNQNTQTCQVPNLAPPPAGQGVQLRVAFDVPRGTEQQRCWRFPVPSTTDLEIVRYQIAYNLGSHHMNLFRMLPSVAATTTLSPDTGMDGAGYECFDAVDFEKWDLMVGAQEGGFEWQLPQGVAYRLHGNSPLLLQSHFVNGSTQSTPCNRAYVYVNLWHAATPVQQHLGTIFANNRGINLPPRSPSSFTTACTLPNGGTIAALTGHFHSRGRVFTAHRTDDGTTAGAQIYRSTDWAEPPFTILNGAGITVPPRGGLTYTCDFFNNTDLAITFGPHVEYEEHCNLFAYYYPADPDARARYCF